MATRNEDFEYKISRKNGISTYTATILDNHTLEEAQNILTKLDAEAQKEERTEWQYPLRYTTARAPYYRAEAKKTILAVNNTPYAQRQLDQYLITQIEQNIPKINNVIECIKNEEKSRKYFKHIVVPIAATILGGMLFGMALGIGLGLVPALLFGLLSGGLGGIMMLQSDSRESSSISDSQKEFENYRDTSMAKLQELENKKEPNVTETLAHTKENDQNAELAKAALGATPSGIHHIHGKSTDESTSTSENAPQNPSAGFKK